MIRILSPELLPSDRILYLPDHSFHTTSNCPSIYVLFFTFPSQKLNIRGSSFLFSQLPQLCVVTAARPLYLSSYIYHNGKVSLSLSPRSHSLQSQKWVRGFLWGKGAHLPFSPPPPPAGAISALWKKNQLPSPLFPLPFSELSHFAVVFSSLLHCTLSFCLSLSVPSLRCDTLPLFALAGRFMRAYVYVERQIVMKNNCVCGVAWQMR